MKRREIEEKIYKEQLRENLKFEEQLKQQLKKPVPVQLKKSPVPVQLKKLPTKLPTPVPAQVNPHVSVQLKKSPRMKTIKERSVTPYYPKKSIDSFETTVNKEQDIQNIDSVIDPEPEPEVADELLEISTGDYPEELEVENVNASPIEKTPVFSYTTGEDLTYRD